ncbi:MAG: phosphatase PAP2 family protein [Spirochaetaceae bacterium]|jgi:membrane-associated phospholipid phosphatase|nr:phosphatase PAP2 family protein [Spirochaetaceae bacterium]
MEINLPSAGRRGTGIRSKYCGDGSYRIIFFLLVFFVFQFKLHGQNDEMSVVPISNIFHNIGWNALNSVTYNYGMNFIGAAAETYIFIETGADWEWRNIVYDNPWISDYGTPGLYIGYIAPAIAPVITYFTGRFIKNEKLQIAGLALAQSVLLTLATQSILKTITGRKLPGLVTKLDHTRNPQTNDFSGEFNWFTMNPIGGWPSSHTANAFAAAAVIAEIYKDNFILKIAAYSYAILMGFSVTLDVHWASEAVAGALIGYAIGKTVGRNFNKLLSNNKQQNTVSFYCTPTSAGVRIVF